MSTKSTPSETKINDAMNSLMQYNVKGALLINPDGLCIASRGSFNPTASGRCAQIMTSAFRLHNTVYPQNEEEVFLPTVTIETDQSIMVINSSNGCYTAISFPVAGTSNNTISADSTIE